MPSRVWTMTGVAALAIAVAAAPNIIDMQHISHAQEIELATFHESAVIFVDRAGIHNTTSSITLQSISTQDMRVPPQLEQQIREDDLINAVILTNQERCILGVMDEACILINMERDRSKQGIEALQRSAQELGDKHIGAINDLFGTDARYHSVLIHSGDQEASGAVTGLAGSAAGRITVSAVYVMPMEDTRQMYEKISSILLPSEIRDAGGFYNAARDMAAQKGARMSFSLVPATATADHSLMQLKVISDRHADSASTFETISPLDLMGLKTLERSEYFEDGFYPLNSIVQVAISSPDQNAAVSGSQQSVLDTRLIGGERIPTDVTEAGWVFDPPRGNMILAKYIFGEQTALAAGDLKIYMDGGGGTNDDAGVGGTNDNPADDLPVTPKDDNTTDMAIVVAVVVMAVAAAVFYLRGYSGRTK